MGCSRSVRGTNRSGVIQGLMGAVTRVDHLFMWNILAMALHTGRNPYGFCEIVLLSRMKISRGQLTDNHFRAEPE